VDLRAGITVNIKQCEQEDVDFIFGLPEGACPGWLSVKYNAAPFRIFFVLTVNGKIVSLASVKEGKSQRRKDIWLLDGLYTLLETDGVRYRGVFFLAARLIDHVLQRALDWGARSVQIVAQHKSVANDCKRVGGREIRKIWGGSEWDIDLLDNGFLQYGNACAAAEATAAAAAQPALATAAAAQAATPVTNDATSASSVAAVAEVTASVAPANDDTSVSTAAVRTRGRGKKKGAQAVRKARAPAAASAGAKKKKKKVAAKKKARLVARSLPRLPTASKSDGVCRRIKRRCWLSPVPTRNNARSGFCFEPLPFGKAARNTGCSAVVSCGHWVPVAGGPGGGGS
jgi:pyruvate/2-oxoglutarate dehydrogenase complex dihydrolipoamide acyltransferase (E2) component